MSSPPRSRTAAPPSLTRGFTWSRALLTWAGKPRRSRLLTALTADRDAVTPRTCDLLAELFTEQGDLPGALDWATVGVERCIQLGDDAELQLLLRLRYRIRVDLGLKRTTTTTCWT